MPGTLVHTRPEANLTEPNGSPALTETNMTTTVSVSTMVEPTSLFEVGSVLFYAVIGGGTVVLAFSIHITSLGVVVWFWKSRKWQRPNSVSGVIAQPQNQGTVILLHLATSHNYSRIRFVAVT